ncbi:MAG: transglutaminase family protein [Vulcanimicrobiaceae bacterium]
MEYVIDHQTTYYYSDMVDESYTIVHLQPRSDQHQFCTRYHLELSPTVRYQAYMDRYGNDVQHFAILPRHGSLSITAHSSVVTTRDRDPAEPAEATRALLEADAHVARYYDFVHPSAYVQFTPELDAFARDIEAPGDRIGAWCLEVAHRIHEAFVDDTDATTVRTTVAEALRARAGVCQDFAHIMIALLRNAKIPARYVSGYIFGGESRTLGAEASHAWCEAYLPPYGWVGFDPTNDRLINDYFVKVAIGRDYRDVSPIRGVYRGPKHSEMNVNVAMDVLAGFQQQQ